MSSQCHQNIKVKVYFQRPPYFDKKVFGYTKTFCDIEEAKRHMALSEQADINFNNLMGICKRNRRFFKLEILTKKQEPFTFQYIEPQVARQW